MDRRRAYCEAFGNAVREARIQAGLTQEELADKSFLAAAVLGVLALGILVRWRTTEIPRGAALTALAGSFVVAGMMGYTGLLGGQIRHTEVRTGATAADAIIIEAPRGSESDERER